MLKEIRGHDADQTGDCLRHTAARVAQFPRTETGVTDVIQSRIVPDVTAPRADVIAQFVQSKFGHLGNTLTRSRGGI